MITIYVKSKSENCTIADGKIECEEDIKIVVNMKKNFIFYHNEWRKCS